MNKQLISLDKKKTIILYSLYVHAVHLPNQTHF